MSIYLKLQGFEDLLNAIESANGSMTSACESAMKGSAQILQSELKSEMRAANVPADLVGAMNPFEVSTEGNTTTARVGYRKGAYDPDNPSAGYKVVFLNYGTPNRNARKGQIHEGSQMKSGGTLSLGFIERAKKKANPKIRKQQKQALNKILERLKK